jgi:hypothetical protein
MELPKSIGLFESLICDKKEKTFDKNLKFNDDSGYFSVEYLKKIAWRNVLAFIYLVIQVLKELCKNLIIFSAFSRSLHFLYGTVAWL